MNWLAVALGGLGLVILGAVRSGRDGTPPLWWEPHTSRARSAAKFFLVIAPIMCVLATVTGLAAPLTDDGDASGETGTGGALIGYVVIVGIVFALIVAFTKVPRWAQPAWLRAEPDRRSLR